MSVKIELFGERLDTEIVWTGSVWQRCDNGHQHASRNMLARLWVEDYIVASGDDLDDHEEAIGRAIETAIDDETAIVD